MTPADPTRLLLIDDDAELGDLMRAFFAGRGLALTVAADGPAGLETALASNFDLVVLDVMLPGLDGFAVLRQLRKRCPCPIIMLTARAAEADRVAGLDAGADDYLTKPFWPDELLARVRAVLRRAGRPLPAAGEVVRAGALELTPGDRALTCGGESVRLTDTEYDILEHLARSAGRVVSRRELMTVLHQSEFAPYDRTLDVHVSHLRKKLGQHGAAIRTVRGEGYLFVTGDSP